MNFLTWKADLINRAVEAQTRADVGVEPHGDFPIIRITYPNGDGVTVFSCRAAAARFARILNRGANDTPENTANTLRDFLEAQDWIVIGRNVADLMPDALQDPQIAAWDRINNLGDPHDSLFAYRPLGTGLRLQDDSPFDTSEM